MCHRDGWHRIPVEIPMNTLSRAVLAVSASLATAPLLAQSPPETGAGEVDEIIVTGRAAEFYLTKATSIGIR